MTRNRPDERGMSTPLSHVLSVGITAILLVGLVSGATGFLDNQSERTARGEMDTIANRLASELGNADTLGQQGDNVTLSTTHPNSIAGSTYTAQLTDHAGECDATAESVCLEVSATGYEYDAIINVTNSTDVSLQQRDGGEFVISSTGETATDQSPTRSLDLSTRVGIGGEVGAGPPPGVGQALQRNPIAQFTFSPGQPETNSDVHFDATRSSDPDGEVEVYAWDFDDDGNFEENGSSAHTPDWEFEDPGWQNVTLRVTDDSDLTNTISRELRVSGLEYNEDMENETGTTRGLTFSVTNRVGEEIDIERILIDTPDSVNQFEEIDGEDPRIEVDGTSQEDVEIYDDDIPADGRIISLSEYGDPAELAENQTAEITILYFDRNIVEMDEEFTIGVRYQVDDELYNANVFNGTVSER